MSQTAILVQSIASVESDSIHLFVGLGVELLHRLALLVEVLQAVLHYQIQDQLYHLRP